METNLSYISTFKAPFWCSNGHIHTIACSLFGRDGLPPCERVEISTPDKDFLELDIVDQQNNQPVITLFHGLEGSSDRYYIVQLIHSCSVLGYSVVAVNFRSCGSRLNCNPRFYHSGETDDYMAVFRWIKNRFPGQTVGAVGFSLGANALLKSLGEQQQKHWLSAAVAVSVPYNLKEGSIRLSKGFNRIYEYRFLRTLREKLELKRQQHSDLPEFTGKTLYDFDNQITSRIHGFSDADDYYARCSSAQFIPDIRKPTLLIHSREDPLCPIEFMPLEEINKNPAIHYVITEKGGHVGFWSRPPGWLNETILSYLSRNLN